MTLVSYISLNKDFRELAGTFSINLITGKFRSKPIVEKRRFIAKALKELGYNNSQIGHVMNKDHSTITNLLKDKNAKAKHNPQ